MINIIIFSEVVIIFKNGEGGEVGNGTRVAVTEGGGGVDGVFWRWLKARKE